MIHPKAKESKEVNRKSPPRNTTAKQFLQHLHRLWAPRGRSAIAKGYR